MKLVYTLGPNIKIIISIQKQRCTKYVAQCHRVREFYRHATRNLVLLQVCGTPSDIRLRINLLVHYQLHAEKISCMLLKRKDLDNWDVFGSISIGLWTNKLSFGPMS